MVNAGSIPALLLTVKLTTIMNYEILLLNTQLETTDVVAMFASKGDALTCISTLNANSELNYQYSLNVNNN